MKKSIFILTLVFSLFFQQTLKAQKEVTTLQHNGETNVFYGINSFTDACSAAENGDTLYLSAGNFTSPTSITKGLMIYGSGHYPNSDTIISRTVLVNNSTGILIDQGADNLRLEGLYIDNKVLFAQNYTIDYVKIIRCNLTMGIDFQSASADAAKSFCSIEECIIGKSSTFPYYSLNFSKYGDNLLIRNSYILGQVAKINGNALITGNILMYGNKTSYNDRTLTSVINSTIQNNIFYGSNYYYYDNNSNNDFNKNIFVNCSYTYGLESNYVGIAQADIFKNIISDEFYQNDYHLKSPDVYISTDGAPIGIYNGLSFKSSPSNPQIISKRVASETDDNGNLIISISVEAQDN